ncbi:MAG: hypothetical protein KY393_00940 [Actinobacteria bacterium]|nr:hypothetical protein [Actinomycetota bacterium]
MILAQAGADNIQMWWITLGVGLVVAAVVTMLLQILLVSVNKVENNVKTLWETATTLARNTATTWLLKEAGDNLEEIERVAASRMEKPPHERTT